MFEDLPWRVRFDEEFLDTLEEFEASSGELNENVKKTIQAIAHNPLKGDPKTGRLRGFRTKHIEHLVIVWELTPEVIRHEHIDDLEEVYFHNIKHHDKMVSAINGRTPVDIVTDFSVTFNSHQVQKLISQLYNCDGIELGEQTWGNDGVIVTGCAKHGGMDQLKTLLPENATIEVTGQRFDT